MSDMNALAAVLNQKDNDPTAALKVRPAVVSTCEDGSCTVSISGVLVAGVKHYEGVLPRPGDVVDVLFDGPSPRVIGVHGKGHGARRIGFQMSPPGGGGLISQAVSTTEADVQYLSIACGKVPANRLVRVMWKAWAGGNTANEWWFHTKISEGVAGGRTMVDQNRFDPGAFNVTAFGLSSFITATAYTNLVVWTTVKTTSGGSGTLYLSNSTAGEHSFVVVEDLGNLTAGAYLDPA